MFMWAYLTLIPYTNTVWKTFADIIQFDCLQLQFMQGSSANKVTASIGVRDRGSGGAFAPPQFGQFVDINSGRESTLFGQNTIHV